MFLGSKVRLVRDADNLTAIHLDIVGSLTSHIPYRPPRSVKGIALLLFFFSFFYNMHQALGFTQPLTEISTGNIKK
jgi:hypothetical protein